MACAPHILLRRRDALSLVAGAIAIGLASRGRAFAQGAKLKIATIGAGREGGRSARSSRSRAIR